MDFFFYGTLMDREVRRAVLGSRGVRLRLIAATLRGFRRLRMAGAPYPILVRSVKADRVDGLLARGLSTRDVSRLIRYEGSAYVLTAVKVESQGSRTSTARVFMPRRRIRATDEPWSLSDWQQSRTGAPRPDYQLIPVQP